MTRTAVFDAHNDRGDYRLNLKREGQPAAVLTQARMAGLLQGHLNGLIAALVIFSAVKCGTIHAAAGQPEVLPPIISNPLGEPTIHLKDPFILASAKNYYLFGITPEADGIRFYTSPDLQHWNLGGWAWRVSGPGVARRELRSPQVFSYRGMFCLVYSARMPSGTHLALAASTHPEGPYHDLHVPWLALGDGCADGHVFIDDNHKAYLFFTQARIVNGGEQTAISGVALNQDLTMTAGQPVQLLEPSQSWEYLQDNSSRLVDNACILKLGSKYYLTYSANPRESSRRAVGYATADKPLGPWSKSPENPLLSTRAETGRVAPGGGSVFRSLDRKDWYMVYQVLGDLERHSAEVMVNLDRLVLQDNRRLTISALPLRPPASAAAVK